MNPDSWIMTDFQEEFGLPFRFEISRHSTGNGFLITKRTSVNHRTANVLDVEENVPIGPTLTEDPAMKRIFNELLRTGTMPSPVERATLYQFEQNCEAEIAICKVRLKEAESSLLDLCREAARICSTIVEKRHQMIASRSIYAPIRSLPPDVLRLIFEMCFKEEEYRINSQNAPLLLCQVCKSWRDAAIDNPFLWNKPLFDVGMLYQGRSIENYQNFLNLIMERVRKAPLALQLRIKSSIGGLSIHQRLLELFLPLFQNCYRLDLVVKSAGWYRNFLQLPVTAPQNLETLSLCIYEYISRDTVSGGGDFIMFKDAPKLNHVILDLWDAVGLPKIAIPYPQLHHLDCRFILENNALAALDTWKQVLRQCLNLESVKLTFLHRRGRPHNFLTEDNATSVNIGLSGVKNLTIINQLNGNLDLLFRDLEFDNLESLFFEAIQPCEIILDEDHPHAGKMHFSLPAVIPLFCGLTKLVLLRVFIAETDFLPIFQSTPYVESLTISNLVPKRISWGLYQWIDEDSGLVQLITGMNTNNLETSETPLLPRLYSLHMYYPRQRKYHEHESIATSYARLVKSRTEMNFANRGTLVNDGPDFLFKLFFSGQHCTEPVISSVLNKIIGVKPLQGRAEIYSETCDTFDWRSPNPAIVDSTCLDGYAMRDDDD